MLGNLDPVSGRLLIYNPDNEYSFVKLFVSEPTPLEEKNLGKVFLLIEIESAEEIYQELIELINDEFIHYYYRSENFDVEAAFEQALQKVNQKLQEAMSEIGKEWLSKFNIVIAVLKGKEMHFTQLGSAQAFLVQNDKIVNIIDSAAAKSRTINPLKIFNNVLSGQLTTRSTMIFCTESLLDYLSPEKIKKTATDNEPKKAAEHLSDLLTENGAQANFAALIIKLVATPSKGPVLSAEKDKDDKEDSMDVLIGQEKTTSELLSPSLWHSIKGSIGNAPKEASAAPASPSLGGPAPQERTIGQVQKEQKITGKKDTVKKILEVLKKLGLQILAGLLWLGKKIVGIFKQPKEYKNKFSKLPGKTTNKVSGIVGWFKSLSTPRKVLLVLVIVLVFVFAQTIVYRGKSQENKELTTKYEDNIVQVEAKINEAKADLLMNNEAGAREKLQNAENLLSEIPEDSSIYEEKGYDLADSLATQLDKLNNVENIDEPLQVADYSEINESISLQALTLIGDNLYAFDADNDSVYQSELQTKQSKTVISGTDKITSVTKDSAATVLVARANGSFAQFNPVLEKYSEVTIESDSAPTAMFVYGPRLYALDAENNNIYKHAKDGDVYGAGTSWLASDKIQVGDAKSIAIDGAVYVLKSEGKVIKLYAGEKDKDFTLEEFSPALTSATKLYTDENTTNLYILDPNNNRLVVFTKDGDLVSQYTSDSFNDLKDMVVDEINKKVYLLAGTQVYQIEL